MAYRPRTSTADFALDLVQRRLAVLLELGQLVRIEAAERQLVVEAPELVLGPREGVAGLAVPSGAILRIGSVLGQEHMLLGGAEHALQAVGGFRARAVSGGAQQAGNPADLVGQILQLVGGIRPTHGGYLDGSGLRCRRPE